MEEVLSAAELILLEFEHANKTNLLTSSVIGNTLEEELILTTLGVVSKA